MLSEQRRGDYFKTRTRQRFYIQDMRPEDISIEDIASSLSMKCRFNGHCSAYYSVAEHCVHIARACPPMYALEGLLHDASEAILVDLPRPIKYLPEFEIFRTMEAKIDQLIADKFKLIFPWPDPVKELDDLMCGVEAFHLMDAEHDPDWADRMTTAVTDMAQNYSPLRFWRPNQAKYQFLQLFKALKRK